MALLEDLGKLQKPTKGFFLVVGRAQNLCRGGDMEVHCGWGCCKKFGNGTSCQGKSVVPTAGSN